MDKDTHETVVIFRKCKDGEVIAFFPELPGSYDPYTCLSYQQIGQHGAASIGFYNETKPATPQEYEILKNELENLCGYRLKIRLKMTQKHQAARLAEIKRI